MPLKQLCLFERPEGRWRRSAVADSEVSPAAVASYLDGRKLTLYS